MKKEGKPRKSAAPASAASLRQDGRQPRGKLSKRPDEARGGALAPPRQGCLRRRLRPDSMALGLSTLLACLKTRKSKRAKKERRDQRVSAHGRSGRSLGPKPWGGEFSVLAGAPSPQKKFLQPIPQAPEHPNKPGKPDIADTPDGSGQPDRSDKPDRPQHGRANRISPGDAGRRPAPRDNTPKGRRRPRGGPWANSPLRLDCGARLAQSQVGAALRSNTRPQINRPACKWRGLTTSAPNRRASRARLRPTNRIPKARIRFPFV